MKMATSAGDIDLLINAEKSPISAQNFLDYANSGFYDGTIFHRVIKDFMIQAGGHTADLSEKPIPGKPTIKNEADNGLSNIRGSLAMARKPEPHTAKNQFFINHKNNVHLDYTAKTNRGWGYAVFGNVVSGMEVVDAIASVETGDRESMQNVPVETITITSVKRIRCPASK